MGFRNGSYAKVWNVEALSETKTKLQISVSRKNKQTGELDKEFSGFVMCMGTACAKKAAMLKKGDSIKLGDVDVTTTYDKEKKKEYVNYKCFSFENSAGVGTQAVDHSDPQPAVDSGEVEDSRLPF